MFEYKPLSLTFPPLKRGDSPAPLLGGEKLFGTGPSTTSGLIVASGSVRSAGASRRPAVPRLQIALLLAILETFIF